MLADLILIISINYSDGTENIRFVTIKEDYDDGMFSGGPGTVYNDSQYTIIQGMYEILLPFFPGETLPSPRRPSLGLFGNPIRASRGFSESTKP